MSQNFQKLAFFNERVQGANSAKITKMQRFENVVNQVVLLHFSSKKKLM